jgi:hypothetical protein
MHLYGLNFAKGFHMAQLISSSCNLAWHFLRILSQVNEESQDVQNTMTEDDK